MKQRFYLVMLLLLMASVQMAFMKRLEWAPDLVVILVIFTGIFRGAAEGAVVGLAAGLLSGCFSAGMLTIDMMLFPAVGAASSLLGKMFYRRNVAVQMLTTLVLLLFMAWAHTLYLNSVSGNYMELTSVLIGNRISLAATVLLAPVFFYLLRGLSKLED